MAEDPPQIATVGPVNPMLARYDEIYRNLVTGDRKIPVMHEQIRKIDRSIDRKIHDRHLIVVSLDAHMRHLKQRAADMLRDEVGVKHIAGIPMPTETGSHYRMRLDIKRQQIEREIKAATETSEKETQ